MLAVGLGVLVTCALFSEAATVADTGQKGGPKGIVTPFRVLVIYYPL